MDWGAGRARLEGAMFAPLRPALARLPGDRWPSHAELDALAAGVHTARGMKESCCGSAGIYTAHAALELYAEAFDGAGAIERLEAFASHFGADFYGLPRNEGRITLEKTPWEVPREYPFGEETVVPLRAGANLGWRFAG